MGRITGWLTVSCTCFLLGLAGCRTFDVRIDWDPGTSFASFERYLWVEPPEIEGADPFADNSLLRKRVRFAIETELKERGFEVAEALRKADFLVTYSVVLEERVRLDGYSIGGGIHHGGHHGFGPIYTAASIRNYQESTLIIDFLDSTSDELLWRGWGIGIVRTRDRDRSEDRLKRGVQAILAAFPPAAEPVAE